jgi:hypothetical protein
MEFTQVANLRKETLERKRGDQTGTQLPRNPLVWEIVRRVDFVCSLYIFFSVL